MRVPGVIYASETLVRDMDEKVREQITNVATLPGIQRASYAMPDAHWGYGFPIGGVAAFDPHEGGIVSAGGVGFDISCGVRTLRTGLTADAIEPFKRRARPPVVPECAGRRRQPWSDSPGRSRARRHAGRRRTVGRRTRLRDRRRS